MKNQIKNLLAAVLCAAAILAATLPAQAALDPPINVFSATTTNGATTLSSAVVTARSGNNGTPRVTFISVGSDLASSVIQAYRVTAQAQCTYTNSTVTIPVATTNSGVNWQSGTVLIRHLIDDTYEKRTLTSNTGSTNVVVTAASLGTVIPGDILYFVTTTGAPKINWSATTNTINAPSGMLVGQQGKPLLLEMNATGSAGTIYCVSGDFVPPISLPRLGAVTGP